jgi:O-antigen ligase
VTSPWLRWTLGAAAALLAANLLIVTTGRSGQLALVVIAVTLVLSLLGGRTRLAMLTLLPLVAAAVIATSPVVIKRFGQGWDEIESVETAPTLTSMGMRVVMWRTSIEVIKDRPWIGYGTGGFAAAYERKTALMNQGWRALPTSDPHNQYMFVWAELGILGLLALLAFIAVAARQDAPRPWKQVSLALLLAWSVTSLFSSHFQAFNEAHLLLLLLGAFLAPERNYESAASTTDSTSS